MSEEKRKRIKEYQKLYSEANKNISQMEVCQ